MPTAMKADICRRHSAEGAALKSLKFSVWRAEIFRSPAGATLFFCSQNFSPNLRSPPPLLWHTHPSLPEFGVLDLISCNCLPLILCWFCGGLHPHIHSLCLNYVRDSFGFFRNAVWLHSNLVKVFEKNNDNLHFKLTLKFKQTRNLRGVFRTLTGCKRIASLA